MDTELRTLRRRIADARPDARGRRRYGEELRRAVIEYAVRREESGDSQSEVARDLRLTQRTLWGWLRCRREAIVKPVELVEEAPDVEEAVDVEEAPSAELEPQTRVLILPSGAVIEGLSLDDVLALARTLS
ncbi:MAG: hypothetical protein AAF799_25610 [Myxococcota bacterium]